MIGRASVTWSEATFTFPPQSRGEASRWFVGSDLGFGVPQVQADGMHHALGGGSSNASCIPVFLPQPLPCWGEGEAKCVLPGVQPVRGFCALIEQIGTVSMPGRTHYRGAGKVNSYSSCHDGVNNQPNPKRMGEKSHATRKPARAIHE